MKIAIMQPYFFPYIGYWQLINSVDKFVILDDVNLITRGFINRNYILIDGKKHLFTIPIEKISQNKLIKDTRLSFSKKEKEKFLKTIQIAYAKTPMFNDVYALIEDIVMFEEDDLTNYIKNSIEKTCDYYDIKTDIILSSDIEKDNDLKAQDRIIEICRTLNAEIYINPPGGVDLYDKEVFLEKNIELRFIHSYNIVYEQFGAAFLPNLSFIDLMMFNSKTEIKNLLDKYALN